MTTSLRAPMHSGSREQAQDLLARLPADLSGVTVVMDFRDVAVSSPSFLDEVVKVVLAARNADEFRALQMPDRARTLLLRAAANRGVEDRVRVEPATV